MRKHILLITFMVIVSMNIWAQTTPICIPVVKSVGDQINQVVVSGSDGSGIFVWQDNRAGNFNIYAQRISATQYMQWDDYITGKLIASGSSNKINVSAVSDDNGGAIVTWQDDRVGTGDQDIYAQWIDNNGNVMWNWPAEGKLICDAPTSQSAPKMARDGNGGAYVTWSDNRGGGYDIYIHHILSNGNLDTAHTNGKRVQLDTEAITLHQINPAISSDGNNGAIIAYEQYSAELTHDIYAQRIQQGTLANMWGDGGVPACIAAGNQRNPLLVNDAVGSAIIVWEDNRADETNTDIYAQRVANSTIQWTADGVAITTDTLNDIHPVIVNAGEHAAIVVWEHNLSATDTNIYAQKIWGGTAGTSGTLQWPNVGAPAPLLVSTSDDTFQRNPQAVADGSGGVIIVYESQENLIGRNDIYGQHLTASGGYTGAGQTGGYLICGWDTDKTLPMLCYSTTATNNAIYAWRDKRNEESQPGIHDIYTLGLEELIEYTYVVSSHDVTNPGGPDLGAEILFNGQSFATPIYTGYTFGIEGNEPLAAGTYTVVHPDYAGWIPVSHTITNVNQNDATDFLGIRYILNVTSVPVDQSVFRNTADAGIQTDGTIYSPSIEAVIGSYTLQDAPYGFVWAPVVHEVVASDFNANNNYTYTIHFELIPDATLPVELSSFTAVLTADLYVNIVWISESEINMLGYRVYRSENQVATDATLITPIMIPATNTSSTAVYHYADQEVSAGDIYYYWLEAADYGHNVMYGPQHVEIPVDITPELPVKTMMSNAYPNPFKANTNIDVAVKAGEHGTVTIYNVLGQAVQTYKVGEGNHNLKWNGQDGKGNVCGSGIYFYKLSTPSMNQTKKMVIVK
ncbi:MAG: T9SS type A sorting domain-containing protein [Candidatus Cloacimonetes bacterium]|nr:T9SS type A sorting domain-containing protein [Candidatus Cloacimonadota bacterium]